jgi:predicted TIM-barrel fold metal-dependent hydrolase
MGGGEVFAFDDQRLYPAYEACQSLGVPVAFTTGPLVGARMDEVSPSRFDAIARDFPDLNLVLAHGGYPYVTESIGLAMRHPNIFLSPDCYTFSPGGTQWLEAADSILAEQIIFASAYPIYSFQDAIGLIDGYPFKPGNRERILGENARRVLAIAES